MSKRLLQQLALCAGLSLGLLACASSNGTPNAVDAAIEHATDVPTDHGNVDRAETSTTPDAREVGTDLGSGQADAHDSGIGGNGSGGAGIGGSGMGGAGGSGMGGAGMGGSGMGGGAGMGGQGGTDAGAGGTSSGTGGATPDAAPDLAAGGTDGAIDSPTDDAPTDTAPACGAGCPANVEPTSLVLWISADVGVTCDSSSPPRVTGWKDRTPGSTVTLAPVSVGPRCDGATLNGTPLPYFDRTTTDRDNSVLTVDLTQLNDSDYTVFVVERRRTANAGFILGTDVPAPLTGPNVCVDDNLDGLNAHLAYRFGYQSSTVFEAGSYTSYPSGDCNEPSVAVSGFSTPQAGLEIDFLSHGVTHSLTVGNMTNPSDDVDTMGSLMQGYLGRAFNLPSNSDSRYLGEVAEVVIYKVALSSTEVTAVSSYLKARWAL